MKFGSMLNVEAKQSVVIIIRIIVVVIWMKWNERKITAKATG